MKKILVPIDFSPISTAVMAEAVVLARSLGAQITLIHIVEPPTAVLDYGLMNINVPEITTAVEKATAQQLAKWRKRLQKPGISVKTVQATGFPVLEIITQSRKLGADYIVMGSHGHAAVYELLIGSTTSGVLKKAACPVLIVPAKKKKAAKR